MRNGGSLALQQVLELAVLRDDLIASLKNTEAAKEAYPLRSIVEANIGDVGRFAEVLNSMPAVRQKRVYATLPAIFGEDWPQKALELFDAGGARAVGEIAKFLIEEGQDKVLVKHLKHELLRQTLPAESLIWICRQRHDASKPLFGLPVGIAMLSLIEQDHMDGGPNRMLRLKNLFMEDKSIIQEMIKGQDVAEVRQFAKMLYNTSAFSEQDRGALMARIISVFPDLHAIVLDALVDNSDKPEPIFVSWESLEARKKELMAQNEMNGLMFKMEDDPRVTKVGKFIRRTSIDELPQFFDVLRGDMSLVGTRPPTVDEYKQYESHHKRRLSMKPGITGLWQVSGRSDIEDFEEVVKLDVAYIDNWSLWGDVKILFKTIYVVFAGKGAK